MHHYKECIRIRGQLPQIPEDYHRQGRNDRQVRLRDVRIKARTYGSSLILPKKVTRGKRARAGRARSICRSGSCSESLKGSGLIAGETLRAYHDNLTITSITARSVGNGAYHVHLGERVVQVEGRPIILTGASALDKALGREVYTSHPTSATDPEEITHVLRLFALLSNPPHACPLRVQWNWRSCTLPGG